MPQKIRLWSGLVLAVFIASHLLNHALGIVSLESAEAFRRGANAVWSNPLGGTLLYASFGAHFLLALSALLRRRTLRLPAWEFTQLALGLLVLPLLATHVVGTRGAQTFLGVTHEYARIVTFIWSSPAETAKQLSLIAIVWAHAAIGIHFWLRLHEWYRRVQTAVVAFYVLVPVLAVVGFYRSGVETDRLDPRAARALIERLEVPLERYVTFVNGWSNAVLVTVGVAIGAVLLARLVRGYRQLRAGSFVVEHPSGRVIRGIAGQTILETLRGAGVAHASVCGGRGRCTTCRVRVGSGIMELPAPNAVERLALERIAAEPTVRLACQTRPGARVSITPLVPPTAALARSGRRGGVAGTERVVTVMFIDLRGSTRLGQARLPYDVLFILNQFFSEMALALTATGGHYAQFNGDGLMAMYGHDTAVSSGARAALAGALEMLRRLDTLNARLTAELTEPLRMGVGLHTGEAIVGTMGPPSSPNFSAIGDNINVAARLEALTKTLDAPIVVSAQTAEASEIDLSAQRRERVEIRGRTGLFDVYAIEDLAALERALGRGDAGVMQRGSNASPASRSIT